MKNQTDSVSKVMTTCPYCHAQTGIILPADFAPVFVFCDVCEAKFIVVRHTDEFDVMTEEDAPCDCNPDCIELEMGAGAEE